MWFFNINNGESSGKPHLTYELSYCILYAIACYFMTQQSRRKLRFWQELKRRGVPRVMAMYAATAFIVIEASDIIFPRFGLPDWTVTLMIILLIVGFPVAFALSWIFDITPQGVIKTGAVENQDISEEEEIPKRRKLRTSDVIIALLLICVLILAYPKIFGKTESRLPRAMRGKISIAVMPFKNMTGDTIYNLWQEGMQNLIITSLSNSQELSVRQFETMNSLVSGNTKISYASLTPALAGELAQKVEANTVVSGTLHKAGQLVRITANIMNAESQEIFQSYEMEGQAEDELFKLADSLSFVIRDYLELRKIKESQVFDVAQAYTTSSEAYKLYLRAIAFHLHLDYTRAAEYYNKAIQVDSNFVSAMMRLAYCYGDQRQAVLSKHWAYEAFERIDRLPLDMQIMVHTVKASADKKPLEQIEFANQYLHLHSYSAYMVYMVAWVNFNLERWDEAIKGFEESLTMRKKIGDSSWSWTYILLGGAYHEAGMHKQEEKIFNEGRELWPDQKATFDYWQAICAVAQGDSVKARMHLEGIDQMIQLNGWQETFRWIWYAGVYDRAESFEMAEYYYRKALELRPDDPWVVEDVATFLIASDRNVSEGLELIVQALEAVPENPDFLYAYALGLSKVGRYDEAYKALQQSWDLTPYYNHKQFTLKKAILDQLDKAKQEV